MYRIKQHANAEIHPTAWVESGAYLCKGVIIGPFCHISANAYLEEDVRLVGGYINLWGSVRIGKGTQLGAYVEIGNGVAVGENCRVQAGAFIPPGVVIKDRVFIGPGVHFTNDKRPKAQNIGFSPESTIVKSGASIGACAVILPGLIVGEDSLVGAGAVVTKSVPDGAVVVSDNGEKIIGGHCDD